MISIETSARVQTLTLNRPAALNAFNDEMYKAVGDALSAAATNDEVSVVIITGSGRAFSAGQDLGEMGDPSRREKGFVSQFGYFIKTVAAFPKPLMAAVNGIGVGIGLTLLPHCDLVYMSSTARLRAPFASLGVTVEAGNSYLLPKVIGSANAADILFTARWLDAAEAKDIGLVFRVSEPDELMRDVLAKAKEIAAMPLISLVTTKNLLIQHREDGFSRARASEDKAFARLTGAPANREAVAAFLEKRAPDFSKLPQ
ncbi:MAG: enoyl-CoA hydratase-related protein [Pseudomonadales bacterium]